LTTSSDKELIEAVSTGDLSKYGILYDRYAPLVRAVCYDTTGNLADAQDLAQDVFLRAFQKLKELRQPELFNRWLLAIARLRCKEWQRQKLRMQNKHTQLAAGSTTTAEYENDGQLEQLRKEIRKLPTLERLALHTFYLKENSVEDAGRIFGLSRSGFYRVLDKARKQLAELMSKEKEDVQ
jgi:RNA polymerase sigma-70 factor, ECF subfamily